MSLDIGVPGVVSSLRMRERMDSLVDESFKKDILIKMPKELKNFIYGLKITNYNYHVNEDSMNEYCRVLTLIR